MPPTTIPTHPASPHANPAPSSAPSAPVPTTFIPLRFQHLHTHFPPIFTHHRPTFPSEETLVRIVRDLFSAPPTPLDPDLQRAVLTTMLTHNAAAPNVPYIAEGILFQGAPRGEDNTVALTVQKKTQLVEGFAALYAEGLAYLAEARSDGAVVKVVHPTMTTSRPICAITHAHGPVANPQPTPILPLESTRAGSERFWKFLTYFWPHEAVSAIRTYCADPSSPGNSIVMSTTCRQAWDNLEFSLLPISATPTQVTVRFHWAQARHRALRDRRGRPKVNEELGTLEWKDMREGTTLVFAAGKKTPGAPVPDAGLLYVRSMLMRMAVGIEVAVTQRMLFGVGLKDCGCEDDGAAGGAEVVIEGCWKGVDGWYDREFAGAGVFPKVWEQFAGPDLAGV